MSTPFDDIHGQIKTFLSRAEQYQKEAEEDGNIHQGEIQSRSACVLRELDRLATAFKNRESGITIDFPRLTEKEVMACGSEVEKYQSLIWRYCLWDGMPTCGVDLACGGKPGVPWAIPFDLPAPQYAFYNSNHKPRGPIALTGHADKLPFENDSLGFIISSHWLEDTGKHEWPMIFEEWRRCLRPGGNLIVLVPEVERWNYAIQVLGQCPNNSHVHEPVVGEMSEVARIIGFEVIEERLTDLAPHDYSILGVFRKP